MVKALIFIVIIGYGFFSHSEKTYSFLVLLSIAILNYISPQVADVTAYRNVYDYIGSGNQYLNTGYGWWLLCNIGNKLHLDYMSFKTIILMFGFILILYSLKKMNISNNALIASYLIYPAITDLIQIRFFLSISIVIFLITFLIKDTLKGYVIFAFGILLIASQIHTGAYFYLVLLGWKLFFKYKKILILLSLIIAVIVVFKKSLVIPIIELFGTEQESSFYLYRGFYASGNLMRLFFVTTLIFLSVSIYILLSIKKEFLNKKELNFLKVVVYGNYLSIFLVILSTFAFTFLRLQKPFWILNYGSLVLYTKYDTKEKLSSQLIWVVYVLVALVWLFGTETIALGDFFR